MAYNTYDLSAKVVSKRKDDGKIEHSCEIIYSSGDGLRLSKGELDKVNQTELEKKVEEDFERISAENEKIMSRSPAEFRITRETRYY